MVTHGEKTVRLIVLMILMTLILSSPLATATAYGTTETLTLNITTPSQTETTIAPGRSFYVLGDIIGGNDATVPDGSKLTVTLKQGSQVVRRISTSVKANTDLNTGFESLSYYGSDRSELKTSEMPDLINTTPFKDASGKCYYDNDSFTALIPGGSSKDQMNWVDENGQAYKALEKGSYTVEAVLSKNDSQIARTTKAITIGVTEDKVLARFSPTDHMNMVSTWAGQKNFRMYMDSFPGYWSRGSLFCEILPEWRYSDAAEYAEGNVHCVLYNLSTTSSSYSVELGALQKQGVIDNPDRMSYYYYSLGEPTLNGKTSSFVKMGSKEKVAFTRAEILEGTAEDNKYDPAQTAAVVTTDYDVTDGVKAGQRGQTIAFYGVTAPIQLADSDIKDNGDNSYTLNNKITKIHYDITGKDVDVDVDKEVTALDRTLEGRQRTSELEFRHCIPIEKSMAGKDLQIYITAYDAHGTKVYSGGTLVKAHDSSDKGSTDKNKNKTAATVNTTAPATGDEGLNPIWIILLAVAAVAIIVVVIRSRKH